jgi:HEAT repeat protein
MATKNRRDQKLIIALAGGRTIRSAAAVAGVSERTAHRKLDDREFRHQVAQARTAIAARTVGRLVQASTRAVRRLVSLLDDESSAVRLGAARAILQIGNDLKAAGELEERLIAVERLIDAAADNRGKLYRGGA